MLALPCDIAGVTTAGGLLQHIVAVELRYAEQLNNLPVTTYEQIPFGSAEEIYTTHDRAMSLLREVLAEDAYDWSQEMVFQTRSLGQITADRSAVLFHLLLHGIRHYGHLATLVRQHGIKPGWQMDYLMMKVRRA